MLRELVRAATIAAAGALVAAGSAGSAVHAQDGAPRWAGEVRAEGSRLAGSPLSGTTTEGGHTLTWAVSGVTAPPSDLAADYDAVVVAGAQVTFAGSATYSLEPGYVTNLSQSASLHDTSAPSFSQRVGAGTYTLPFSLSVVAPKTSGAQPGQVATAMTASVSSRNCNDSGVCGGPRAQIRIAVLAGTGDDEKPQITVRKMSKIHADVSDRRAKRYGVAGFPFKLVFAMSDNSGTVKGDIRIFSDGKPIRAASTKDFVPNGRYSLKVTGTPPGAGPFYWCAQAKDPSGNYSPIACEWMPVVVRISAAGVNGCGTAGYGSAAEWLQNYFGDVRTYGWDQDKTNVLIRNACNIHDAAYTGATIWDAIDKRYVNFQPWSRAAIDRKFRADIRTLCQRDLGSPKRMAPYLRTCRNGVGIASFLAAISLKGPAAVEDAGATTYYEMVRSYGGVGFDADSTTPGIQSTAPGMTNPGGGGRNPS